MSSELSVSQILSHLEGQMALCREKEAFHAEQESFHRDQRARYAAEYASAARIYESLQASAETAAEIAARATATPPPPPPREEFPPGKTPRPHRLAAKVVADLPAGEVFGCSDLAKAIDQRFGHARAKPLDPRVASTILRRMAAEGWLRVVRKGTPHHEAMYTKV